MSDEPAEPGRELQPTRPALPKAPQVIETSGIETAGQLVSNPLTSGLDFNLSVPPIEVEMVNASALADYETWLFSASLAASAMVGFGVASLQSLHTDSKGNLTIDVGPTAFTGVSIVLLIVFLKRVRALRQRIKQGARKIRMRASEVVDLSTKK